MRVIGWLCVIAAPLAMTLGVLVAQMNTRVYGELCGQGRIWACGIAGAEAARMCLMVAVGLLAYGILIHFVGGSSRIGARRAPSFRPSP